MAQMQLAVTPKKFVELNNIGSQMNPRLRPAF
ncbi:hypothetical protein L917_04221 [Phytophthora nicotianae]|uniref:Uncharacterized protein n=1 Tax=Phytophthora nicotianae TaxID=4792 RepID=W2LN10_PHYNI|nr:hypothetical protein L915_04375 [Phytophthora nicotianae]ETL45595.1 hypothetical protein L916_04345 [Phytophthora nicotianae]ETL98771.1 hypothetical protein L917_04221 [Phytophthora nicotianae]